MLIAFNNTKQEKYVFRKTKEMKQTVWTWTNYSIGNLYSMRTIRIIITTTWNNRDNWILSPFYLFVSVNFNAIAGVFAKFNLHLLRKRTETRRHFTAMSQRSIKAEYIMMKNVVKYRQQILSRKYTGNIFSKTQIIVTTWKKRFKKGMFGLLNTRIY